LQQLPERINYFPNESADALRRIRAYPICPRLSRPDLLEPLPPARLQPIPAGQPPPKIVAAGCLPALGIETIFPGALPNNMTN
jgi:hypothetical protein